MNGVRVPASPSPSPRSQQPSSRRRSYRRGSRSCHPMRSWGCQRLPDRLQGHGLYGKGRRVTDSRLRDPCRLDARRSDRTVEPLPLIGQTPQVVRPGPQGAAGNRTCDSWSTLALEQKVTTRAPRPPAADSRLRRRECPGDRYDFPWFGARRLRALVFAVDRRLLPRRLHGRGRAIGACFAQLVAL